MYNVVMDKTKTIRVSEKAHKKLRIQSANEGRTIKNIIDSYVVDRGRTVKNN